MTGEALAQHLERPLGRGHAPEDARTGAAGGAACGDLIRVSLAIDPDDPDGRIADAGFDASGCGAAIAAGSAIGRARLAAPACWSRALRRRRDRRGAGRAEPAKRHAAELAADALHRALGSAARAQARARAGRPRARSWR